MAAKTVNVEAEIEFLLSDKARKDSKSNTAKALSEEAFLKCWEALGTNNDADRIKVMLNALQQWRQGIPGRSRAPISGCRNGGSCCYGVGTKRQTATKPLQIR